MGLLGPRSPSLTAVLVQLWMHMDQAKLHHAPNVFSRSHVCEKNVRSLYKVRIEFISASDFGRWDSRNVTTNDAGTSRALSLSVCVCVCVTVAATV